MDNQSERRRPDGSAGPDGSGRESVSRSPLLVSAMLWLAALVGGPVAAQELPLLRTAVEARQLCAEEAERHYPVRLRGVLTFFDESQFYRFVQDETCGIYFYLGNASVNAPLAAGQLVEIQGHTSKGEYAPILEVSHIEVLGPGVFPAAKPVSFGQLASGQEDSQFVQVNGIVRSVRFDSSSKYYHVEIATGDGRLTALAAALPMARSEELEDSEVSVRGACVTRFNRQRQLFDLRLLVPRPEDFTVARKSLPDPFATATQPMDSLLQFAPQGSYGHRTKVAGTVSYRVDDTALYLQHQGEGLYVETKQSGHLQAGDEVEVLGFPARGDYTPKLEDAIFRKTSTGAVPQPERVRVDEALKGTYDCRLVRIEALLLDRARHSRKQFLVLQADGFIFHAHLEQAGPGVDFAALQNDSKVAVTGICRVETGSEWRPGDDWRANSFRLLLRSPADVVVLAAPPWWTLRKLLWMVGLLGAIIFGALAWVAVLRRRVSAQTAIIRQKLATEASLKERYEDLFENANDMVYTHDLQGCITSINKMGERLLQRRREAMLSQNIVDLVAPEQRVAARQWLDQVLTDSASGTAEWDFISASGHRVKLEISTRLIEQNGQRAGVEGNARDITDRRRMEREILEISNREQRRIGHDLHDGVCQQLAGIAYRVDILEDLLRERGVPELAEAESIGRLINEANTLARSVARGLFPVRLEDNGLACALEELTESASSQFRVQCRFACAATPDEMDNEVALHLYFIAQEAIINAVKHGRAGNIRVSLESSDDRFLLVVKDDGAGFTPAGASRNGMGIRIMRHRASVIGATLGLKSEPGSGTRVACEFYPASREALRGTVNE